MKKSEMSGTCNIQDKNRRSIYTILAGELNVKYHEGLSLMEG
jgi:hypothetical protein